LSPDPWTYSGSAPALLETIRAAAASLGALAYSSISLPATLEVVGQIARLAGVEPQTYDYSDDPATPYIIVVAHLDIGQVRVSVSTDRIAKARAA